MSSKWATGKDIYNCLTKIFDNSVHIIHPDFSSIDTPVDSKTIDGIINYIEVINELIRIDGGKLKKPTVIKIQGWDD